MLYDDCNISASIPWSKHKQRCTHKHMEAGQLWSLEQIHTHAHVHTHSLQEAARCCCLYFVPHEWEFHLLPFSLTDTGSVSYSPEFDTVAVLITFLVRCQTSPVNSWIWVTLSITLRQQGKKKSADSLYVFLLLSLFSYHTNKSPPTCSSNYLQPHFFCFNRFRSRSNSQLLGLFEGLRPSTHHNIASC